MVSALLDRSTEDTLATAWRRSTACARLASSPVPSTVMEACVVSLRAAPRVVRERVADDARQLHSKAPGEEGWHCPEAEFAPAAPARQGEAAFGA